MTTFDSISVSSLPSLLGIASAPPPSRKRDRDAPDDLSPSPFVGTPQPPSSSSVEAREVVALMTFVPGTTGEEGGTAATSSEQMVLSVKERFATSFAPPKEEGDPSSLSSAMVAVYTVALPTEAAAKELSSLVSNFHQMPPPPLHDDDEVEAAATKSHEPVPFDYSVAALRSTETARLVVLWRRLLASPQNEGSDSSSSSWSVVCNKPIKAVTDVLSMVVVPPVLSEVHAVQTMLRSATSEPVAAALLASGGEDTFSVLWLSAAWCPPCLRALDWMPTMQKEMPSSIRSLHKADMDLTHHTIFALLKVSIIPTFVIFSHKRLIEALLSAWASTPLIEGHEKKSLVTVWDALAVLPHHPDMAKQALTAARVESLQNSQFVTVKSFLEKHCEVLSFGMDEEF